MKHRPKRSADARPGQGRCTSVPFHVKRWALDLLAARSRLTVIAFASADGVVGFPSFHAALGVVTVWIVRHSRLLVWPVLALNAVMMVAVLPVGGHHLAELLGGTLTGIAAVTLVSTVIASAAKQSSARR